MSQSLKGEARELALVSFFFFSFPVAEAIQESEDFSLPLQMLLKGNGEDSAELLAAGGSAACSCGGRHEAQKVKTEPVESIAFKAPLPQSPAFFKIMPQAGD